MLWQGGKDGKAVEMNKSGLTVGEFTQSMHVDGISQQSLLYYIRQREDIYIYSKGWYLGAT